MKEEVPVLPPPNNIIFSEEEIEVCETIDVWNCDAAFEVPPQATPLMKTPSSDTLILPIKFNLKPGRDENSKDRPISKITETVQHVQHCTSTPSEGLHNNKRNSKKGDLKSKASAMDEAKITVTAPHKVKPNNNHSVNTEVRQPKRASAPQALQKLKCLLVYDDLFNDFDSGKFSARFDISKYRAFSVDDILSKDSLISKVRNLKPETVLLHVGHYDLFWHKTSTDDLLAKYKQVIYKLLESTETKICISLIIPVPGYPYLNESIQTVNDHLSSFISNLRVDSGLEYGGRIFTSCNNQLGGYITRGTDRHGVTIFLSEGGRRKAWLILKDALQRTLGLNRDRETKLNLSRRTNKKDTNE